jgi:hypothetical protein
MLLKLFLSINFKLARIAKAFSDISESLCDAARYMSCFRCGYSRILLRWHSGAGMARAVTALNSVLIVNRAWLASRNWFARRALAIERPVATFRQS